MSEHLSSSKSQSLDLILIRDCPAREGATEGQLLSFSHMLALQETLHRETAAQSSADVPPPDGLVLGADTRGADVSLGDLRARLQRIWPLLAECVGCPLNVTGRAIGCHTHVEYPLTAMDERAVAHAAGRAAHEAPVAEALLARTPVATPSFREPRQGMFESAYAPFVSVPWEGSVRGVPLDAFWDMLLAPRSEEDGVAAAAILTCLQQDLEREESEPSLALQKLALMGYALRVWHSAEGHVGYAVSP